MSEVVKKTKVNFVALSVYVFSVITINAYYYPREFSAEMLILFAGLVLVGNVFFREDVNKIGNHFSLFFSWLTLLITIQLIINPEFIYIDKIALFLGCMIAFLILTGKYIPEFVQKHLFYFLKSIVFGVLAAGVSWISYSVFSHVMSLPVYNILIICLLTINLILLLFIFREISLRFLQKHKKLVYLLVFFAVLGGILYLIFLFLESLEISALLAIISISLLLIFLTIFFKR